MQFPLFIYNILLISAYLVCLIGMLQRYSVTGKRLELWGGLLFAAYEADNLRFFIGEAIPETAAAYGIVAPLFWELETIVMLAIMLCYRMTAAYAFDSIPSRREKIAGAVTASVLLVFRPVTSVAWVSDIYGMLMLAVDIVITVETVTAFIRARGRFSRRSELALGALVFLWAGLLMGVNISSWKIWGGFISAGNIRNLCSELLGLAVTVGALVYLAQSKPPQHPSELTDELVLRLFADSFRLTPRETEILPLLLAGDDNAAICEKCVISLSTAKVHIHNIFTKLNVTRRAQIAQRLAEFRADLRILPGGAQRDTVGK